MEDHSAAASQQRFVSAHPQWWMGLMLLALHAALAWGINSWWPRAFLLAHIGLFLMWQPVWRGERDIEPRYAFLVVIVGFFLAIWILGFIPASAIATFLYLKFGAGERWPVTLAITASCWLFFFGLFDYALQLPFPQGALFEWLPVTFAHLPHSPIG